MLWQPINLNEVCPVETHLSACSPFAFVYLNLLVRLFGDSRDRRHAVLSNKREDGKWEIKNERYDFIVVGAGAAGCVVANRLSAFKQWKVLLLEAGPEQPDVTLVPALSTALLGSNIDWAYTTEPNGKSCLARPGQRCNWPRGKTMGGSSSINSLSYIRGNRKDYDDWAAMGNIGWSYEDVLPYFKKSERNLNIEAHNRKYHGIEGEQPVSRYPYFDSPSIMMTEAFEERGLPLNDYNGKYQYGSMQAQSTSKDGVRVSTNNAFIQPIRRKRKNLTIKVNSEAVKILINKNNKAYGVNYIRDGKSHTVYADKEVILSGGVINSPKLLMLSGVGPKKHLAKLNIRLIKDLDVGENLHDHVTFNGIVVALRNHTSTLVDGREMLHDIEDYCEMDLKAGPISGNGPVNTIAFYKTDPSLLAPDVQFQVAHVLWREYVKEPTDYERLTIYPTAYYDGMLPRTMNLVPRSRGKLLLNQSNPNGAPLIYPNYFDDPTDFMPIIKGVRFLLTLENTRAFKSRGAYFVKTPLPACKGHEWGSDAYIVCLSKAYTSSTYHPVGSCKMGPKWDKKAVVDPKLRVYGISRLRVIDSAIMPIVPRGNTNAPSIMVGERGVAFVIADWLKNTFVSLKNY